SGIHALSLHDALPIFRFDQVVLIRRVRAGSVAQAEVTRGQAQRRIGEDIARPGARATRPQLRVVPELAIGRELRADQPAVGVGRSEEHTSELQSLAYL